MQFGSQNDCGASLSDIIEISRFDTADLAPQDRFRVWQASIGVAFDVSLASVSDEAHFKSQLTSLLIDGIVLSRNVSSAQRYRRDPSRIIADGIDHYMFQVYERGGVDLEVGRTLVRGRPGSMVLGDMAEPMESANSDNAFISAIVPRRRLDPHLRNSGIIHGAVIDTTSGSGQLLAEYLQVLFAVGEEMTHREAMAAGTALILLIAAACNKIAVNPAEPPDWADHALVLRARIVLMDHLHNCDLTPAILARRLGLSRTRLYEMFRPYGGVMRVARELRLRRALNDLVSPRGERYPIGEIAYRWGFSSPPQFTRSFRARFGCSPKDARNEGRIFAARRAATVSGAAGNRKFEAWLEMLA